MTDPIDHANDAVQFATDLAIHQHQFGRELPMQQLIEGAVACLDCGDVVSLERLRAVPDCVRCIECQAAHENWLRR